MGVEGVACFSATIKLQLKRKGLKWIRNHSNENPVTGFYCNSKGQWNKLQSCNRRVLMHLPPKPSKMTENRKLTK